LEHLVIENLFIQQLLFSDKSLFRISRGRPGVGHRLQEQSRAELAMRILHLLAVDGLELDIAISKS
jgi:hypothetical protein